MADEIPEVRKCRDCGKVLNPDEFPRFYCFVCIPKAT